MKTIGVTGYKGRLGRYLLSHHSNFVALDCDVSKPDDVERCLRLAQVDGVLHLAAKSEVDWCEKPENESLTTVTNLRGTFNVCHSAKDLPVVLLSSDHVFDGVWGIYKENSKGNPVNYYGMTKFAAEGLRAVFDNLKVIRTSYLFNLERLHSQMSNLWNGVPDLYPTFIFRTFLYLPHFVEGLVHYFNNFEKMPKMLHISGTKSESWHGLMTQIAQKFGVQDYKELVLPRSQELASKAPRPFRGGLNTGLSRKLKFPQYSYLQGINQMIKDRA